MKPSLSIACILLAFAVVPSSYARKKYDHVGRVQYHPPQQRYLLDGRTDLFYDGDYICTPGDKHHAPDCRKNWWVVDAQGYKDIILDDGTRIVVFDDEEVDLNNVFENVSVEQSSRPEYIQVSPWQDQEWVTRD